MTLVGKKAPAFKAKAVVNGNKFQEEFSLEDYLGRYVIFFFYPLDFTFVCPTELIAFQKRAQEFEKRGCSLVACSVDSHYSHHAWLARPQTEGGIQGITYPIVSDITKEITRAFGILKADEGIAYRGLFLIDKEGVVRHELVNDLPLGRSVDEALRMLEALIFFDKNGEVCPANWHEGEKAMRADEEGLKKYFNS